MKRIRIFGLIACVAAGALLLGSVNCSKQENPAASGADQSEPIKKPEEPAEMIYTRDDPGAYGGKEDSHVPRISYEKTESGLRVSVTVEHEMNAEKPHFIEWIKLLDGENNELGITRFRALDAKAEAVFELSTVPARISALEKCNLHGIWKEEIDIQ